MGDLNKNTEEDVIDPTDEAPTIETPLLQHAPDQSTTRLAVGEASRNGEHGSVAAILCLLLLGVFISSADSMLIIATNTSIASSFSALEHASWLSTSYAMTVCAIGPVMGKLSDIYGRKSLLLINYVIFFIGTLLSGIGQDMFQVIVGRSIAGLGGAGMLVLPSIIITDIVPMRDVAVWRSYVNIFAVLGRGAGGPVGGLLADTVGWRWSLLGQLPLIALSFLLVAWKLKEPSHPNDAVKGPAGKGSRIGRIDFLGAGLIAADILTFLFAVDIAGTTPTWKSIPLLSLLVSSLVLAAMFIYYEARWAREPIYPPFLLTTRNVWTTYLVSMLQMAAQTAMMFSLPLYFQVTENASDTVAGFHLVPAVAANAIGSLLTGFYIKRSGRYKWVGIFGPVVGCIAYGLLVLRWHGVQPISTLESLVEIIPGGFATGMIISSTFTALGVVVAKSDMAVATSGYFLTGSVGMVLGVSISTGIQRAMLRVLLKGRLGDGYGDEAIEKIVNDVGYVAGLTGELKDTVVGSYTESLRYSHGFSLASSIISFVVSLFIQEIPLEA